MIATRVRGRADPVVPLGRNGRRAALTVHILGAGAWIGIDVVLGVLVFTALFTTSTRTAALCYQALELFAVWPLLASGVLTLVSGVVLGLGTRYGLVRYWWVAVKLGINVVLVVLVAAALRPGLAEAASYGELLAAGQPGNAGPDGLAFPPVVSGLALVAATILAVYKPWRRVRAGSATPTVDSSP